MDLIERQKAIDAVLSIDKVELSDGDAVVRMSAVNHVLRELPSAQPENADCIYCHEDSDGYVKPIEKNCHAFIRFGMDGWELDLKANGWHCSTKIRFCPMCGRELGHG